MLFKSNSGRSRDVRTALYRHYDKAGQLLYVGISLSVVTRISQHRDKRWFEDIARIDVQWHCSRHDAEHAEAVAIWRESPKWNVLRPACDPGPCWVWDHEHRRYQRPSEIPF